MLFKAKFVVQRHYSKKNEKRALRNRRTGKLFICNSGANKEAESWLLTKLQVEALKQQIDTITEDINLKLTFYFPKTVYFTKKNERSQKLGDLSNLIQGPEDALQKVGIIKNDAQIISYDGTRRTWINDTRYWLEIEITSKQDIFVEAIA